MVVQTQIVRRSVTTEIGGARGDRGDMGHTGAPGSGNLIGFSVDDYCTVNTAAGNTAGLAALAAAINAAGGGVVDFTPGKTYMVGTQTFGPASTDPSNRFYKDTGVPGLLLEIENCTQAVIIRGNGAKIKLTPGLKYGTFDATGTATSHTPPYFGPEAAAPYINMMSFTSCSGLISIENIELDGNSPNVVLGGPWGDTGYQLGGNGLKFNNNTGGVRLFNVNSHHHLSDGIQVNGGAMNNAAPSEQGNVSSCKFNYNSRLGLAFVGGRGWNFRACDFNWNANTSAGAGLSSNPASGVDFEAEGGHYNRDVSFYNCDFIGNYATQIVADSGTPTNRVSFRDCKFVQTNVGGYCVWVTRPGFKAYNSLFAGTMAFMYSGVANAYGTTDPFNPFDAFQTFDCHFTNSNDYSPTGTVGTVNSLLFENGEAYSTHYRALLEHNVAGTGTNGAVDAVRFVDATVRARAGTFTVAGRFAGRTHFIEDGGTIGYVPGGLVSFKSNSGHAEDPWFFTTGGVTTEYPATLDPTSGKAVYYASATYDPPSLAAGAKTGIQTITVTGAALGDKVAEASFSQNLAGAVLRAWVSATDTVSFHIVNENGANPLDLASGTVRVKVVKA